MYYNNIKAKVKLNEMSTQFKLKIQYQLTLSLQWTIYALSLNICYANNVLQKEVYMYTEITEIIDNALFSDNFLSLERF